MNVIILIYVILQVMTMSQAQQLLSSSGQQIMVMKYSCRLCSLFRKNVTFFTISFQVQMQGPGGAQTIQLAGPNPNLQGLQVLPLSALQVSCIKLHLWLHLWFSVHVNLVNRMQVGSKLSYFNSLSIKHKFYKQVMGKTLWSTNLFSWISKEI